MRKIFKEHIGETLVYLIFGLLIVSWHFSVTYISDDAINAALADSQSWFARLGQLFNTNGRVFTDGFADLFYRLPLWVWQAFDSAVFVVLAWLIATIFTSGTCRGAIASCALVGLFPYLYLNSAGWIATTANYLYTVFCLFVIAYCLQRLERGERFSWQKWVLVAICSLYAANQDQTAAVLVGGLGMYAVYCLVTHSEKRKLHTVLICLAMAVGIYIIMLMMPGHINRMHGDTGEVEYWLPQYAQWSLGKKLWIAYSTTMAPLAFGRIKLALMFYILLAGLALKKRKWLPLLASLFPIGMVGYCVAFGGDRFICTYDYSCGMKELCPGWLPAAVTFGVLGCLLYVICTCMEGNRRWLVLGALTLGVGSRLMMGLSHTIYASSFRTFTPLLFCIIVSCALAWEELKAGEKDLLWYAALAAACVLLPV